MVRVAANGTPLFRALRFVSAFIACLLDMPDASGCEDQHRQQPPMGDDVGLAVRG
jgi:hypothetical protein